jgi:hypothetical protein
MRNLSLCLFVVVAVGCAACSSSPKSTTPSPDVSSTCDGGTVCAEMACGVGMVCEDMASADLALVDSAYADEGSWMDLGRSVDAAVDMAIPDVTSDMGLELDGAVDLDMPEVPMIKKALLIFIDGFIPEGIDTSQTPALDALLAHAASSRLTRAESTTISGSGWSSFLTGVHWDKHQVPDNAFLNPNYTDYPHIFARLKQARPQAVVGGCQSWGPIETGLVEPSSPDFTSFHDYYDYDDDYWDAASCDSLCAEDVIGFAAEPSMDLLVVMFGELDGVAHQSGYGANFDTYQRMLTKTDGHVGDIVAAIKARPTYDDEDWLVIVGTDHSGNPTGHHGQNIPEHRLTPLIVSGPSVALGEIWPPPQTVDIVPTALKHLGVSIDPAWGMDGVPVGFQATGPPVAAFDQNLIFNGDAEYERGYEGYEGVPDSWLPGWVDPGELTVVRYDSPNGYPTSTGPGPSNRGSNFFAGGATTQDTYATWTVDVSPLAAGIDAGANYRLAGWLGGYSIQDDAVSLTASFRDAGGIELAQTKIGPVVSSDRGGVTGLFDRSTSSDVPSGTRQIEVRLEATRVTGSNDGYADNLSLVLTAL